MDEIYLNEYLKTLSIHFSHEPEGAKQREKFQILKSMQ